MSDLTPEEQAAVEATGAEPLTIPLPPDMAKGLLLYEMADGRWGFRPLIEGMQLMDIFSLCQRAIEGARADLLVNRMMERGQAQKAAAPKIIVPQVGQVRR